MKKIWIASLALFATAGVYAQQTEGRVVYERTAEIRMSIAGGPPELQQMMPRSRTDMMEVLFANNQSLRKPIPQEENNDQVLEGNNGGGGGVMIRTMIAGMDDVTFTDFAKGRIVEQREFAAKKYIIEDSVHKLTWKLTGETKTILGYTCQQAIAQRIGVRMQSSMTNGELKTERIADTSAITAWFTPAIPVAVGPDLQGQLPGLILALDFNNGRVVYKAVEVSPKINTSDIKEPKGGKKMTQKEFTEERDKMMKEMQRNGGGSFRAIRAGS